MNEASVENLSASVEEAARKREAEFQAVVKAGTNLPELLERLCPDGVVRKPLSELLAYEQPTKYLVKSKEYSPDSPTPVLTAGQTFVLGYTDETEGIYQASKGHEVIIFDDFTTAMKWVNFPFKVKSSAMKMLTVLPGADVLLRYVFYAMESSPYVPQDHSRQWLQTYSKRTIPVPPVEVQEEIVRILDLMTELEAELEAELEKRRLQYAHYRDALLSFKTLTNFERERERESL